jgi:hypothetical protein
MSRLRRPRRHDVEGFGGQLELPAAAAGYAEHIVGAGRQIHFYVW